MSKYLSSFEDGVWTGLDPIGTILGNVTGRPVYVGAISDKYGTFDPLEPPYPSIKPKERNLGEQTAKAVGDLVGLAANIVMYGMPQALSLGLAYSSHLERTIFDDNYPKNRSGIEAELGSSLWAEE